MIVTPAPDVTHGPLWYLNLIRHIASARWFTWLGAHVLTRLDKWLYPRFHGRLVSAGPPILPLLFLTTTGRKSGRASTTPLVYLPEGDDFVVVASNWGQRHHPNWSANLVAQPRATIDIAGQRRAVVARLVTSEERPRLWRELLDEFPPYAAYAKRSGRDLRIFVLRSEANDPVA